MAAVFGCIVERDITTLIDDGVLVASSPVARIPYIGPFFRNRLNAMGCVDVEDFVAIFSRSPPRTATDIEARLSKIFQNRRRAECSINKNNSFYHVSFVNQCGFNLSLQLLRVIHARRTEAAALGFSFMPNIPNARNVQPRRRGTDGARRCACHDETGCNSDYHCRWYPDAPNGAVCSPRFGGNGFGGVTPRAGQRIYDGSMGEQSRDGQQYFRRWLRRNSLVPIRMPMPDLDYNNQQTLPAGPAPPPPPAPAPAPAPAPVVPVGRRTRSRAPIGGPARRTRSKNKRRRKRKKRSLRRFVRD